MRDEPSLIQLSHLRARRKSLLGTCNGSRLMVSVWASLKWEGAEADTERPVLEPEHLGKALREEWEVGLLGVMLDTSRRVPKDWYESEEASTARFPALPSSVKSGCY